MQEKDNIAIIEKLIMECSKNKVKISNDTDLVKENVLDSFAFVKFINKLEETFNVKFSIFDLVIDNFRNVHLISNIVMKKCNGQTDN